MRKIITVVAALFIASVLSAGTPAAVISKLPKQTGEQFFIFTERGSRENHFIPSGYMGDYGDIKMNAGWEKNPGAGKYCLRVDYTADRKQGAGWAGVYWQSGANNWGDKRGGFDLSQYKKVTFMARGEKGGETIDKFGVGGITGQTEEGDSDQSAIESIELTKDWKKYEIDITGLDFTHIIGGFLWVANADMNPKGLTFYLDEIQYVKK